jgi:putative oxidoreductase
MKEVYMTSFGPGLHALMRIVAGLLFMQHGAQKLFGWLGAQPVALMSQMGLAGVLEFGGGALIVLGLFTRPVAAILFLEMIVAYLQAHLPQGPWPVQNDGELALLYAGIFAFLAANGAGPFSIDAMVPAQTHHERRHTAGDRRMHVPGVGT